MFQRVQVHLRRFGLGMLRRAEERVLLLGDDLRTNHRKRPPGRQRQQLHARSLGVPIDQTVDMRGRVADHDHHDVK